MPFPTIRRPSSISGGVRDPLLEDDYQSGDDAARPVFTSATDQPIRIGWKRLSQEELDLLDAFVRGEGRTPGWPWPHPYTGEEWSCRLCADPLSWSAGDDGKGYNATLTIKRIR